MAQLIDLFAGPGGLGEGFSAVRDDGNEPVFHHALSIEMEPFAFETLKLRTFYRCFPMGSAPDDYYRCLRQEISRHELYTAYPNAAKKAEDICWRITLGPGGESPASVHDKISATLKNNGNWVLIGGPPCQAYSLAGRSRNRGKADYVPTDDVRQKLYVEYLQILADHRPAVFVMENVKGLLSATLDNVRMYQRILDDLGSPLQALARERRDIRNDSTCGYRIYSLTKGEELTDANMLDTLIRAEEYGIPQTRHRVILLGIRSDLPGKPGHLQTCNHVSVEDVIGTLPRLRSGLSRSEDSASAWRELLRSQLNADWTKAAALEGDDEAVLNLLHERLQGIKSPDDGRGKEFVGRSAIPAKYPEWYIDPKLSGVCNHHSRGHMPQDLYRYLYAACYAEIHGKSPSLRNFPHKLLPKHLNVEKALEHGSNFSDRFRVQIKGFPGTTVVSHISKDGHYYIHYDPSQSREKHGFAVPATVMQPLGTQASRLPCHEVACATSHWHRPWNRLPPHVNHPQLYQICYY